MNTLVKLILGALLGGIVIVILLVVGAVKGVSKIASATAAEAPGAAEKIASFSLPEGYRPEYALRLAGYTVVGYNPGDGRSHLILAQAPSGADIDQAKLDEMLRQAQPGRTDRTTRLTVVEKRPVVIRGQQVTLVISEGTNSSGELYREATAAFQGKSGPAMLVISEPVTRWDVERIIKFVGSIK